MRALAASMHHALGSLWGEGVPGSALVAIGGCGRGELAPCSDVDLLVLHKGRSRPDDHVRALLYELWNAGFEVGHATRTVKESLKLAGRDLQVHTSFFDARLVGGDEALFDEFSLAVDAFTRTRLADWVRAMADADRVRHHAHGEVPFMLEPNLKDGAGGLRDLHVARWLARFVDGVEPPSPAVEEAAGVVHAIRCLLHDETGRRTDVLLFDHQDPAGAALGYPGEHAGDALMRAYYDAARSIWGCERAAIEAATGSGRADGVPTALRGGAWTPDARERFGAVLAAGDAARLEELDRERLMERLFPGWEAIRNLPQRNIYHRFTVDYHCFEAVAQMAALGRPGGSDAERLPAEVWRDVADPRRALLAALFHDAGKGAEEDHSVRGARLAQQWTAGMGMGEHAAEEVAWLVRNHLLLAETATRRDTGDERLVESVAAQAGTAERLKMLYALTVADARATGPEAWTPWKAALVAELFDKALRVLERGEVVGAAPDEVIARRTAEVRRALPDRPPGDIDAHLLGMTRAYVLAFPGQDLARHVALATPLPAGDELRMNAVPAGEPGVYEVTFVARDRPGLFATMSGALAVAGINIIGAQAFTRADGCALEVFRVVGAQDRSFDDARWARLREVATASLRGTLDIGAELAERRVAYARTSKGKREPPRVVVDNAISDFATVVEVHAPDRVGLLYDITRTLTEADLDIHVARVATYGHDVVDAFYVRDLVGQRLADADRMEHLRRRLLDVVGG